MTLGWKATRNYGITHYLQGDVYLIFCQDGTDHGPYASLVEAFTALLRLLKDDMDGAVVEDGRVPAI